MGEANDRGTKDERQAEAIAALDRDAERIAKAISERGFSDGLVWMVIEHTNSVLELNADKSIRREGGKIVYGPNNAGWKPVIQEDLPEWVKDDDVIQKMMNGGILNMAADAGGAWWRGRIHVPRMH